MSALFVYFPCYEASDFEINQMYILNLVFYLFAFLKFIKDVLRKNVWNFKKIKFVSREAYFILVNPTFTKNLIQNFFSAPLAICIH